MTLLDITSSMDTIANLRQDVEHFIRVPTTLVRQIKFHLLSVTISRLLRNHFITIHTRICSINKGPTMATEFFVNLQNLILSVLNVIIFLWLLLFKMTSMLFPGLEIGKKMSWLFQADGHIANFKTIIKVISKESYTAPTGTSHHETEMTGE